MTINNLLTSNYNLKSYNTFALDSVAEYFVAPKNLYELALALEFATTKSLSIFPIGAGSNSLLNKTIAGLVLKNSMQNLQILDDTPTHQIWRVEAGYNWHKLVLDSVNSNLYGIERLAFIPGNVGAAPVQNIGAYGCEIKDALQMVEVMDKYGNTKIIENSACQFEYRNSIFKKERNYLILAIYIKLHKNPLAAMQNYPNLNISEDMSSLEIAEKVIELRKSKLPDYTEFPNVGSFFKNPIISESHFYELQKTYTDIPHYNSDDGIKIPAAWLIEQAGYKGKQIGNLGMYKKQPLVMVKYGAANLEDIFALAKQIQTSIKTAFAIELEIEAQQLQPVFVKNS